MAQNAIGSLAVILSADVAPATKQLAAFTTNVDKVERRVKRFNAGGRGGIGPAFDRPAVRGGRRGGADGIESLAALGPIGIAAAVGMKALSLAADVAGRAIDMSAEAEKNRIAFESMTGSASAASKVLRELRQYATDSPFSVSEVNEAGKQLMAFGITAGQLPATVRALGDVVSATGGDFNRLARAYGQVKTTGKLMGDELNQFAEQGVPLIAALAEVMQKPESEIKRLVEEGQVGFDTVTAAIERLTAAGGKFGGLSAKYAQSFAGIKDRASDAADSLLRDFGTSLIEDFKLKDVLKDGIRWLNHAGLMLNQYRPALREAGVWMGRLVKLATDASIAFGKGARLLAAFGKAAFGPELKAALAGYEQLKKLFDDFDTMDLQEVFHRGVAFALDELEPLALGVADVIDGVSGAVKKFGEVWDGVTGGAKGAFDAILAGVKAVAAPLDLLVAKLKGIGEVLKDPNKLAGFVADVQADVKKLGEGWGQMAPQDARNLKGDFDVDGRRREFEAKLRGENMTARERVQAGLDAARKLNLTMEELHRAEKYRLENVDKNLGAAFGPGYQKAKDFAGELVKGNAALSLFADATKQVRQFLGFQGERLNGGNGITQKMRDDARNLNEQFADPLLTLGKKAKELDAMFAAGLIDGKTRGLAFDAEANRLAKGGRERRLAPSAEVGSQEFVRLVQSAVGNAPKDQLAILREQLALQKQIAANGNALLDRVRQAPPPKVQPLPGE